MAPEAEIAEDFLESLALVEQGLDDALTILGELPGSRDEFAAMPPVVRVASTAMLKQVEQMEDLLAGLFRAILRLLAVDTHGMYAIEIGRKMEGLGIVDDAQAWVDVVKLRNRLVHEYPPTAEERFKRLGQAFAVIPLLRQAHVRARRLCTEKGWVPER